MPRIEEHVRQKIVHNYCTENGVSYRNLAKHYKVSVNSVKNIIIKFGETCSLKDLPKTGRKKGPVGLDLAPLRFGARGACPFRPPLDPPLRATTSDTSDAECCRLSGGRPPSMGSGHGPRFSGSSGSAVTVALPVPVGAGVVGPVLGVVGHRGGEGAQFSSTSGGGMQGSGAYLGEGGYPGFSHSCCSSSSAVRSWACHFGDSSISFNRRSQPFASDSA